MKLLYFLRNKFSPGCNLGCVTLSFSFLFSFFPFFVALKSQVSASKVLQETCSYIRSLHKEVDDLSERLSQLLATVDADSAEAAIIRSLIK